MSSNNSPKSDTPFGWEDREDGPRYIGDAEEGGSLATPTALDKEPGSVTLGRHILRTRGMSIYLVLAAFLIFAVGVLVFKHPHH